MRDYRVVGLCVLMIAWALFLCCCTTKPIILEKECTSDVNCSVAASRCADGVDPYHVCGEEGRCVNLTFIADPCRMSHTCPNGDWDIVLDGQCFKQRRCQETGCDDGSNATLDVCINQNLKIEGCRYTVINETTCASDKDCVPEQCCHPTTCINSDYRKPCDNMMCTMECRAGTMDCGQGSCVCRDNKCAVKTTTKTK